jgi:hypothetical protein
MAGRPSPLSRLFDLALEIERHHNDQSFAEDGGRIHYVFDENIFELFAFPGKNRRMCHTFLDEDIGDHNRRDARNASQISAESAVVTGEILFGGALPGQKDGEILLSKGHREELLDRMSEEIIQHRSEGFEDLRLQAERNIEFKTEMLGLLASGHQGPAGEVASRSGEDSTIALDVQELRKFGAGESELAAFRATRRAALQLATDKHESQLQLERILSEKIQDRIHGVASLWRPSSREFIKLNERASYWEMHVRREIRNQRRQGARRPRSTQATRNDSEALALLEWVSARLPPTERIVLVTGDSTLINTYRRHFNTSPFVARSRLVPFLIRTPLQYSALLNTSATVNSTLRVGATPRINRLFRRVREALDLCLVTFQVAKLSTASATTGIADQLLADLQHLTLEPMLPKDAADGKRQYQPNTIDQFWTQHISSALLQARLREIGEDWRSAERLAIGLATNLVAQRIGPEQERLISEMRGKSPPQQRAIILAYVESVIARLARRAMEIWKPIARRFFQKSIENEGDGASRVPLAIKLDVSDGGSPVDLVRLLTARGSDANLVAATSGEFLANPFELFLATCILALLKREYRLTAHFSDMATSSFEFMKEEQPALSELRAAEAYYAAALSQRIQIARIDMCAGRQPASSVQRHYKSALTALDFAEKYGAPDPALPRDPLADFRDFRLASERVALEGFMAMQYYVSHDEALRPSALEHYKASGERLQECLAIWRSSNVGFRPDSLDDAVGVISRQFLINISAWFVLGSFLIETTQPLATDPLIVLFDEHVIVLKAAMRERVALLGAELLAFDILRGKSPEACIEQLRQLVFSADDPLEMDHHMFREILSKFAPTESQERDLQ